MVRIFWSWALQTFPVSTSGISWIHAFDSQFLGDDNAPFFFLQAGSKKEFPITLTLQSSEFAAAGLAIDFPPPPFI